MSFFSLVTLPGWPFPIDIVCVAEIRFVTPMHAFDVPLPLIGSGWVRVDAECM